MIQYKILISYNRNGSDDNFYQTINVIADNKQDALNIIDNYEVEGLFDSLEDDYVEDSLYAVRIV